MTHGELLPSTQNLNQLKLGVVMKLRKLNLQNQLSSQNRKLPCSKRKTSPLLEQKLKTHGRWFLKILQKQ
jgi:hypothetical protein